MNDTLLIIFAACGSIGVGLLAGWLGTKIYHINEDAAKKAKEKLDEEFLG